MTDSQEQRTLDAESKKAFLRVTLQKEIDSALRPFAMAKEMARAKKNRSPRVLVTVFLFTLGLAAIAAGVTVVIQHYSTSIPIDISDFEYLAFRDLADTVRRYDREIETAGRQIADLTSERDDRLRSIRDRTAQALELADLSSVTSEERTERSNELARLQRRDLQRIMDEYARKIGEAEATRKKAQAQLDTYDQRQLAEVRRRERLLDTQRETFDAEMTTKIDYYENRIREIRTDFAGDLAFLKEHQSSLREAMENNYKRQLEALILKYNPIFESDELVAILKEYQAGNVAGAFPSTTNDAFVRYGLLSDSEQQALDKILREFTLIIKTLRNIEYKNSIPPSLALIDAARVTILGSYATMSGRLAEREQARASATPAPAPTSGPVAETFGLDEQYRYAINTLAALNATQGYVIDARDTSRILVFMQFGYTMDPGDRLTITREDDTEVAILRVISAGSEIYASLEKKLSDKYPITPFDRVTIAQ